MDTKQRTRSGNQSQKNRSTAKHNTDPRRRSPDSAKRREGAARPSPDAARRAQRPAQPRQASPQPKQAARPIQSDAPEMVFKPEQQRKPQSPEAAKRAAQRRKSAQRTQERKKQAERQKNRPAVVYTQPKPFNLNRLLLQMALVMAVVLAVVMGLSVFFKVETVVVYGNHAYSAYTVQEAAGIEGGENLMTFSRTRASGKIIANLPYVESARIGIKLPDTVNIYIEEIDVAYAIQSDNGTWWLMTSGGKVVEQIDSATASSYTKVLGVELDAPAAGEAAKAVEEIQPVSQTEDTTEPTEMTVTATVTGADRLKAALVILASLETNDVVGEAASVDVTSLSNIELWYGSRYQVKLGDTADMDYKIASMKTAVAQMNEYEMGILDVSFTTWTDQPGFTPFD